MYKPRFRNRKKRCFELSTKTVLEYDENKNCLVIYGKITDKISGMPLTYEHGWVMEGNIVYDPVKNIELSWEEYQSKYNAKIFKKFTKEEIVNLMLNNEMYGIFDEIREEYNDFMCKDQILQCPVCKQQFQPFEKGYAHSKLKCPNKCNTNNMSFLIIAN
jgi:hypothetical protein